MNWRQFLWPFSLIFGAITSFRNLAFDQQWLKSQEYDVPVIAVGNLSTGGTGKTPMVEYLVNALKDLRTGVVSRGYGRKTKGLILARNEHTAREIGDEPFQIFRKYPHINLALSEKRTEGIGALMEQSPQVILMDDAYQHRYVKPGFQVLLTTYASPFFEDLLLPAGNLRESSSGSKRANAIVITKCPPSLPVKAAKKMVEKVGPGKNQQVFFTTLEYEEPVNARQQQPSTKEDFVALSGIANPALFLRQLSEGGFSIREHLRFADHHHFSESDLEKISSHIADGKNIITTEKDWVRLMGRLPEEQWQKVYYLPVKVKFLFDEEKLFLKMLRNFIGSF